MSRIKRNNVQFGQEFIVPLENIVEKQETPEEKAKLKSAETKAQEIIEEAKKQSAQLIEDAKFQAQEEIDAATEEGRKAGFQAGEKQGFQAISKELTDKIVAVNDFAKTSFELKNEIIKSAHLDIVNLIIQISQKICTKSLKLDENILKEITIKAISALKDKESINIIVNPEMAGKIYEISDELKERISQLKSIKIIEDKSVSPDGTIIESPLSRVDDRISSQINEISEKLLNSLNSAAAEELMPQIEEKDVQSDNNSGERKE